MAYLVGCSIGDGHISQSGKKWALVDGSSDQKRLELSGVFVKNLSSLLKTYGIHSEIRSNENKYELRVNNKPFCRFLHFFFGLPYGPKKKAILQVPLLLRYFEIDKERYFWRGCFDTDGYVGSTVGFCSSDNNLLKQCEAYLASKQIQSSISKPNVSIILSGVKKFSVIGFAHPRKQIEYLSKLRRGATYTDVRIKAGAKIEQQLLQIYDLLRIDPNGYRIRVHAMAMRKKGVLYTNLQRVIKSLFDCELRKAANGMYYFKSKEVYDYLQSLFKYAPSWEPLNDDDEDELMVTWNDVWLS